MGKKIFIIHTSNVSYNDLQRLCAQIIPEVKVRNIVDDSLLQAVRATSASARQSAIFHKRFMLQASLMQR